MSLNFNSTRIDRSTNRKVATGHMVLAEGAALVADSVTVRTATGAANERFVGFSFSQQNTINAAPMVEDLIVNEDGEINLAQLPLASSARYNWVNSDGTVGASATPASSAAKLITFTTGDADRVVRAQYKFAPTAAQAGFIQGNVLPGGDSGHLLGNVGVITAGDVYTSEYDTTVDWTAQAAAEAALTMAANGQVTVGGAGGVITGARIISVPTPGSAYLGIALNNG